MTATALDGTEAALLRLLANGLSIAEVARQLSLGPSSVHDVVSRVVDKCGGPDLDSVVRRASVAQASDRGAKTPATRSRIVHRGPGFTLGVFTCPPDDPLWDEESWVGNRAHIVFPSTTVGIEQRGFEITADPNCVIFFDADRMYRRRLVSREGDRAFFAEIDQALLRELVPGREGPLTFPALTAPVSPLVYALQWRTVSIFSSRKSDALVGDEVVIRLLGAVVREAFRRPPVSHSSGYSRIVERAKVVLEESLGESLSLTEIARRVSVSPFHLTRLFDRHTGMTLHRYRTQLRLRRSLARLAEGTESIQDTARALGFSSHSHFTSQFRKTFGFAPSLWREGAVAPSDLCETALSST